jgi:hypothetical protein
VVGYQHIHAGELDFGFPKDQKITLFSDVGVLNLFSSIADAFIAVWAYKILEIIDSKIIGYNSLLSTSVGLVDAALSD